MADLDKVLEQRNKGLQSNPIFPKLRPRGTVYTSSSKINLQGKGPSNSSSNSMNNSGGGFQNNFKLKPVAKNERHENINTNKESNINTFNNNQQSNPTNNNKTNSESGNTFKSVQDRIRELNKNSKKDGNSSKNYGGTRANYKSGFQKRSSFQTNQINNINSNNSNNQSTNNYISRSYTKVQEPKKESSNNSQKNVSSFDSHNKKSEVYFFPPEPEKHKEEKPKPKAVEAKINNNNEKSKEKIESNFDNDNEVLNINQEREKIESKKEEVEEDKEKKDETMIKRAATSLIENINSAGEKVTGEIKNFFKHTIAKANKAFKKGGDKHEENKENKESQDNKNSIKNQNKEVKPTKNYEKNAEKVCKTEITPVGDELDSLWHYVQILLDYNIIDFTSK